MNGPFLNAAFACRNLFPRYFQPAFWSRIMIRHLPIASALLTAVLLASPAKAASFDGPWSVTIVTQSGQCDAAYNFPLEVVGGRIISAGSTALTGRVSGGGAVSVSIVSGASGGKASGRLSGGSGAGRWSGVISGNRCGGRWEASRR